MTEMLYIVGIYHPARQSLQRGLEKARRSVSKLLFTKKSVLCFRRRTLPTYYFRVMVWWKCEGLAVWNCILKLKIELRILAINSHLLVIYCQFNREAEQNTELESGTPKSQVKNRIMSTKCKFTRTFIRF